MTNAAKGSEFGLKVSHFSRFGDFAAAGLEATEAALQLAASSLRQGRIPIAGAAVELRTNGRPRLAARGCNNRIPAGDGPGYPADHGETAAIRSLADPSQIDWSRTVFATTLSPCIMCARSLEYLHSLGLRRIAVAEARSYPGQITRLSKLPAMKIVCLSNRSAVLMMQEFARTYPWDWAADIGEIPPRHREAPILGSALVERLLAKAAKMLKGEPRAGSAALVTDFAGSIIAGALDERFLSGGNPCRAAVIQALGRAGSRVNIRECLVVFSARPTGKRLTLEEFGHSSLGACELFRPAAVLTDVELAPALRKSLAASRLICAASTY